MITHVFIISYNLNHLPEEWFGTKRADVRSFGFYNLAENRLNSIYIKIHVKTRIE